MNKKFLFAVIATTAMGNAWADDGRILTTQTYVDNELAEKQDIISGTESPMLVATSEEDGVLTQVPLATNEAIEDATTITTDDVSIPTTAWIDAYTSLYTPYYINNDSTLRLVTADAGGWGALTLSDMSMTDSNDDDSVPTTAWVIQLIEPLQTQVYDMLSSGTQGNIVTYSTDRNGNPTFGEIDMQARTPGNLVSYSTDRNGNPTFGEIDPSEFQLPAGNEGEVATFTGIQGDVYGRGVYNDPTENYYNHENVNENKLITVNASAAIVDYSYAMGLTCAQYHTNGDCLLYNVNERDDVERPLPYGGTEGNNYTAYRIILNSYSDRAQCITSIVNVLRRTQNSAQNLLDRFDAGKTAVLRTYSKQTKAENDLSALHSSGGCNASIERSVGGYE